MTGNTTHRSPDPQRASAPHARPAHSGARAVLSARLLQRQLRRILHLVDLEAQGRPLAVDSFLLHPGRAPANGPAPRSVQCEALLSYSRNEPRLEVIKKGLDRALRFGRFMADGACVSPDAFRLRHLRQWAGYPATSLDDTIGSISSYCNCDCEFCYEKGTRGAGIALGRAQLTLREVQTRLKYYSPEKKTGLLPSSRFSLESFANPHCLEILEKLHAAQPNDWINITTNGSYLTEDVVARLAQLRPIMLSVSLNAASVDISMRTMRYRTREAAETALASPELLRKHQIPFIGSYVPWPSKPLSDLEDAVRLLDRCDAVAARICLPSWTRFSAQEPPFDTATYWSEILAVVDRMRREVAIPLRPTPNMYDLHTIRPVIQGTTKHSPAAGAGFQYGDLIVAIDGEPVYTRPEVSRWLGQRFQDPNITRSRFTIERSGRRADIEIPHPQDPETLRYPYYWLAQPGTPVVWGAALGLHLADGPELTSFVRLLDMLQEYPGKRVLLFISQLMEPCFYEGMSMLGERASVVDRVHLYLQPLPPAYWGGNVMVGDLWTAQDFIEGTAAWIENHGVKPDVVIVPSSFLSLGARDLVGRCYLEVERALDVEVRLLPCYRIVI
jgi:hypothetical protein